MYTNSTCHFQLSNKVLICKYLTEYWTVILYMNKPIWKHTVKVIVWQIIPYIFKEYSTDNIHFIEFKMNHFDSPCLQQIASTFKYLKFISLGINF